MAFLKEETARAVRWQEDIGLDVLVHGEFERNDMVQYFGEQLAGFAFTRHGWVQSYGSRYVRPPVLFGDVSRPKPMTVRLVALRAIADEEADEGDAHRPGHDPQLVVRARRSSAERACKQIALAIRDEVADLEEAGASMIQIDEAALREGLPLRTSEWGAYLDWAVQSFRICSSSACVTRRRSTPTCATRSSTTSSTRSARWTPT